MALRFHKTKPRKSGKSSPIQPTFRAPPIDEVVCGIRFEPLNEFRLPFYGVLWQKIKEDFPIVQHVPPLTAEGVLSVEAATGAPLPRVWFINQDDDELVQFQPDHLLFNWRRRKKEYARYNTLFPKFQAAKESLDQTLKEVGQGPIKIVEQELSYINHVPQGEGWEKPNEAHRVFPAVRIKSSFDFLPPPDLSNWALAFPLPKGEGRLSARLSHAKRVSDQMPLLVLQLSVKGKPATLDEQSSRAWFDTAHDWIVNAFLDLTDPVIQKTIWQRVE